jgi:hypothetical protein
MAEQDHAADIAAARLAQIDERLAAAKDEVKSLTEQRKAYLPKKD